MDQFESSVQPDNPQSPPVRNGSEPAKALADETLAQIIRLATQHHQAGQLADAEAEYRRVLVLDPAHAGAIYGLGTLALQVNQCAIAGELIRRAIALQGEWPEACYHLGLALQGSDQFDLAIPAHRRAIALNPKFFEAQYNLAVCLQVCGERDKAIAAYEQAIAIKGDDPFALVNFAIALRGAGRLDEAISALRRAVAIKPDFADAFGHLGAALREKDDLEEAIAAMRHAVDLASLDQKASMNLAAALGDAGRIDEAIVIQRQAVALGPEDADAHAALGALLLLTGDYAQGFPHFEWRWRQKALRWPRRRFSQPLWDGGDLSGQTIYLHAEQSIGDTIQFLRLIPLVERRGGKVVVECQKSLRRLLHGTWNVHHWFSPGDPLPDFDVYSPLLSLPAMLGLTPQSIHKDVPYLHVAQDSSQAWRKKVPHNTGTLKVGLAWAGSPSEPRDRQRSVSFSQLSPIADIEGVQYFSLQKGWAASQAYGPDARIKLTDFTNELTDFADTAALIGELDLVISVDTAVAHLAGALGKMVWTLLPFVPHWRWTQSGEETPWYPTMRLFRQKSRGDWSDVISRVAAELGRLVSQNRSPAQNFSGERHKV